MTDVLLLGREIEHPSREYPDHVWRAMRLAYAMHYRTLLEFFHNGRGKLQPSAPPPRKRDMIVADVLPPGVPLGIEPTTAEKKRFRAADKLAAHLSRERTQYHAAKQEWGCLSDRRALRRRINALFGATPQAHSWFPTTAREL